MNGEEVAVLIRKEKRIWFFLFVFLFPNTLEHLALFPLDLENLAGCRAVPFPMVNSSFFSFVINVYLTGRGNWRGEWLLILLVIFLSNLILS